MNPSSSPSRLSLPSRTTPTWEVELLISGAVALALFQLLAPLEHWYAEAISGAPSRVEPLIVYSYFYVKLALFVLIATFVLHIAARAAWVALVGVHSIYPGGPKWENLSAGPIGRRVQQQMSGDIDAAIERADNRATLVFSYGILAAQFTLVILIATLATIAIARLLEWVITPRWAFLSACALLLTPLVLFNLLDKLIGARLRPGGWAARCLESGVRVGHVLTLSRLTSPLQPLVTTHIGGRRGTWVLIGVVYLALAATGFDSAVRAGRVDPLRGEAMPEVGHSHGVLPAHYASMRESALRYAAIPHIDAPVSEGPYLRLFLPYSPDRHDAALQNGCANAQQVLRASKDAEARTDADQLLAADRAHGAAQRAFIDCFAALFQLRLDGVALRSLRVEHARDPLSGHLGGLAMIDVRSLAPGRHEVEIARLPVVSSGFNVRDPVPEAPDRIVFWR